jgi:uncharacterized protein YegL
MRPFNNVKMISSNYKKEFGGNMMKKSLTELVFILDRSGSMSGLESDTIGGYNAMIEKQKNEPGSAFVTTVLFDHDYELLHDRINLKGLKPITDKEYYVCGTTALLDAIGRTIQKMINVQKHTADEEKAEQVLFVITTDGMENSSHEYSYSKIREMIEYQKKHYKWEFIFLGANMDAISTAERFGIDKDRATTFKADREGVSLNYDVISETISHVRASHNIDKNWKSRIDDDVKKRGNV